MFAGRSMYRSVTVFSLALLCLTSSSARLRCIAADGTVCFLCPKLLQAAATNATASQGACQERHCCCSKPDHTAAACDSMEMGREPTPQGCPDGACTVFYNDVIGRAPSSPAVDLVEEFASPQRAPDVLLSTSVDRAVLRPKTHWAGPPPDLIVLGQHWII
jgi:hypothetical protein